MKTQKMTKQVQAMVTAVNEYMITNHIKSEEDTLFSSMEWLLLQANCYHGFNYFTVDGRLSGGNATQKFDHLEFYIQ